MINNQNQTTPETELTGKYLVLFREDAVSEGIQMLGEMTSFNMSSRGQSQTDEYIFLNTLGVAVVSAEPEQVRSLRMSTAEDSPILAIEPERVVYTLADVDSQNVNLVKAVTTTDMTKGYLQGYRDAVNHLVDSLVLTEQTQLMNSLVDESVATWGLQATNVVQSSLSGQGIKIAVLDTGFELNHPDFIGRTIISKSFIQGEEVQDKNGHGTHCIGTACGPRQPSRLPRYGVAYNSEIYVGKVLSNKGSGSDGGILQGIEWAVANGCHIISMSLGAPTQVGTPFSRIYETVAQRALSRGTLIIAAAGNESNRGSGIINPVALPANSPSIMAVAALDSRLQIANFSNRGVNPQGGQIDIAGPGVQIYSSWFMPTQYITISGTSMATPHVAGIAALHAEATGLRGQELWNLLMQKARRLPLPSEDVGVGLVQAP
ncbi:S8 family peptidase [Iningainema tapete]|uniref:S8 family serine peptidase n=1 Tax=Iningainema tapete BLCC-T55 TaxID=2748662 RepID=A0A8J7CDP9_9CYAN|nr:S8 family serine peptidase [Iningainema tapete]MBD2773010.1 S8 family serine peptidase [Iningainema tapete BLCC-T55]